VLWVCYYYILSHTEEVSFKDLMDDYGNGKRFCLGNLGNRLSG